jgi:hypothetical protein
VSETRARPSQVAVMAPIMLKRANSVNRAFLLAGVSQRTLSREGAGRRRLLGLSPVTRSIGVTRLVSRGSAAPDVLEERVRALIDEACQELLGETKHESPGEDLTRGVESAKTRNETAAHEQ